MDKNNKRTQLTLRFQDQLSPEEIESLLSLDHGDHNIPHDFKSPTWNFERRVHNWHNYAGSDTAALWETFTLLQKAALALNFERLASDEQWD